MYVFKCCSSNFSSGDKAQGEVDDISLRCKWLWLLFLIDEYLVQENVSVWWEM